MSCRAVGLGTVHSSQTTILVFKCNAGVGRIPLSVPHACGSSEFWAVFLSKVLQLKAIAERISTLARNAQPSPEQREAFVAAEARAYSLLATAQWHQDDLAGAELSLDRALSLRPSGGLMIRRAVLLPRVLPSREGILAARENVRARLTALAKAPAVPADVATEVAWTLFLLAYHGEHENLSLHRLFHTVCRRADPKLSWIAPHCSRPRRTGRPRVGFISWHFCEHTISRLFTGLLQAFDSEAFDVSIFSFQGQENAMVNLSWRGKHRVSLAPDVRSRAADNRGSRIGSADLSRSGDGLLDAYFWLTPGWRAVREFCGGIRIRPGSTPLTFFSLLTAWNRPMARATTANG